MNDSIAHEQKIGRNDPCFCGSGKKYKVCCLRTTQAPIDFAWKNLRRLEGQVIDEYLGHYIENHIPERAFSSAINDLLSEEEMPEEMKQQLFSGNFLMPWFLFNWIPKDDYNLEEFEIDKPIALQYIKKYPNKLNSQQKNFVETLCKTHYSFFVILEVVPNQSLLVKDILLEKEVLVKEKLGTQLLSRGDIVLSRILTFDNQSIFIGMPPFVVHARHHAELIQLRGDLIKEGNVDSLTSELLRDKFEYDVLDYYFTIIEDSFRQPLPEIQNTDGDPLQLCKSFFTIKVSPEDALRKLLPLTLSNDAQSFLREAKRDKSGKVSQLEFPWLKKGNKKNPDWDNTLLGNIRITHDKLTLETNSERRANKGHQLLTKYLKEDIQFQKTVIESMTHALQNLENKENKSSFPSPTNKEISLEDSPETQAKLKQMTEKHWENWFDQPIPMLGNKTPREAAKTKEGREQLEALLLYYERMDLEQENNLLKVDVSFLKARLGL